MKIMFYINTISFGGAERVIVNLAKQFSKKGYEVIFVTTYLNDQEYELPKEIQREILLDRKNYGFIKKNFRCVKELRKLIKIQKPDILISFMAEPNFRSIVSCLGTRTKTLISIRNDPNKEYGNALFRFCAKYLYRFASGIVFQTKEAQLWFPDKIRKKSKIIFNQVNESFFCQDKPELNKDIVTVGRLVDQKNHALLIEAFAEIAEFTDENLIIYGDGDCREMLENLVDRLKLSDRVFLPGTITDVANTIKTAKLFVLSSDYEGMPNALIEAMTLGLPCISTDCPCGGPRELFHNQQNGLLVPICDKHMLAQKIMYLINDGAERNKVAENARRASDMFSPEIVFGNWEAYVNEIVDK